MTYAEAANVFQKIMGCGEACTAECAQAGKCVKCGYWVSAKEEDDAFRLAIAVLERMAEIEDDGK